MKCIVQPLMVILCWVQERNDIFRLPLILDRLPLPSVKTRKRIRLMESFVNPLLPIRCNGVNEVPHNRIVDAVPHKKNGEVVEELAYKATGPALREISNTEISGRKNQVSTVRIVWTYKAMQVNQLIPFL